MSTTTLFRPVGPKELELIEASGWREFPPWLPEPPIFHPVTNEGPSRLFGLSPLVPNNVV
jgi:hypothetical protein